MYKTIDNSKKTEKKRKAMQSSRPALLIMQNDDCWIVEMPINFIFQFIWNVIFHGLCVLIVAYCFCTIYMCFFTCAFSSKKMYFWRTSLKCNQKIIPWDICALLISRRWDLLSNSMTKSPFFFLFCDMDHSVYQASYSVIETWEFRKCEYLVVVVFVFPTHSLTLDPLFFLSLRYWLQIVAYSMVESYLYFDVTINSNRSPSSHDKT